MTARIVILTLALAAPVYGQAPAQPPIAAAEAAPDSQEAVTPRPAPAPVVAPVLPTGRSSVSRAMPQPVPTAPGAPPVIPAAAAPIPVGSRVGELMTTYESGGRRDPFSSLVTPQRAMRPGEGGPPVPSTRLSGVALADVLVRGVVRSGDTLLAILEGPNRRSFVGRVNDHLLDATVVRIDAEGVIFAEKAERGRAPNHLRKSLRPSGEEFQ